MVAAYSEEKDIFTFVPGMEILWHGGVAPIDAPIIRHDVMVIDKYLLMPLFALASFGILISLGLLSFNIIYSNHP